MALYTKSGLQIAIDYERIIVNDYGGRYYEIHPLAIFSKNIFIPKDKEWKKSNQDKVDYIEYRAKTDYVKIYYQIKTVGYADYKIGFYYVSVNDLIQKTNNKTLEQFI